MMKKALCGISLALAAVVASGAAQAGPVQSNGCKGNQVFQSIGDLMFYVGLVDGDMEGKARRVKRDGDAKLVNEQATLGLGGKQDSRALRLREGGSASLHQRCDKWVFPTVRFAYANTGSSEGTLRVEVRYKDLAGVTQSVELGTLTRGNTWQASPALGFLVATDPLAGQVDGDIKVTLTAVGDGAEFLVDDVYIDPRVSW